MSHLSVLILAAGKSTRMKSKTGKLFHKIAGRPLISYAVENAMAVKPSKIVLVIGKGEQKAFEEVLGKSEKIKYCVQSGAKGTGDAVMRAEKLLKNLGGHVLILPGDVPMIYPATLRSFVDRVEIEGVDCAITSADWPDPSSYGRVVRDEKGRFVAIREERDATDEEKKITEINTGVYLTRAGWLFEKLKHVKPDNAQKEYYLTDVVELATQKGELVTAHMYHPHHQFIGINGRADLSIATDLINQYITEYWMNEGVTLMDPDSTYIDSAVRLEKDVTIAPNVTLRGATVVKTGSFIDVGTVLEGARIEENVHVKPYCVIEDSIIKESSVIGPFARIRPGSVIENNVKIGNFVEIKKSVMKAGSKASHLSYIGDAVIGREANVGCGTITCNYDGKNKYKTVVGDGVFVGSDVQFIAPVKIGKGAVIGAGTTVTKNVPPDALAISRVNQVNVKGWAKRRKKG